MFFKRKDLQLPAPASALPGRDVEIEAVRRRRFGRITTEIAPAGSFYYAEAEHQQYLAKHPMGYCGVAGTGTACLIPIMDKAS